MRRTVFDFSTPYFFVNSAHLRHVFRDKIMRFLLLLYHILRKCKEVFQIFLWTGQRKAVFHVRIGRFRRLKNCQEVLLYGSKRK